jgi:hypothetical protein
MWYYDISSSLKKKESLLNFDFFCLIYGDRSVEWLRSPLNSYLNPVDHYSALLNGITFSLPGQLVYKIQLSISGDIRKVNQFSGIETVLIFIQSLQSDNVNVNSWFERII